MIGDQHEYWCDGTKTLGPDPYASEIAGDETPVLLCACERADRAADI